MQHLTELLRQWFNSDNGILFSAITMLIDALSKLLLIYTMSTKTYKHFVAKLSTKTKGTLVVLLIIIVGAFIPTLVIIFSNSIIVKGIAYFLIASFVALLFIIKTMSKTLKP